MPQNPHTGAQGFMICHGLCNHGQQLMGKWSKSSAFTSQTSCSQPWAFTNVWRHFGVITMGGVCYWSQNVNSVKTKKFCHGLLSCFILFCFIFLQDVIFEWSLHLGRAWTQKPEIQSCMFSWLSQTGAPYYLAWKERGRPLCSKMSKTRC